MSQNLSTLTPGQTFDGFNGKSFVFVQMNRTRAKFALLSDVSKMFEADGRAPVTVTGTDYEALGKAIAGREGSGPTLRVGAKIKTVNSRRAADNGLVGKIIRVNAKTYTVLLGEEKYGYEIRAPFSLCEEISEAEYDAAISAQVQEVLVNELAGPFGIMEMTEETSNSSCWAFVKDLLFDTMDEARAESDRRNAVAGGKVSYPAKYTTTYVRPLAVRS